MQARLQTCRVRAGALWFHCAELRDSGGRRQNRIRCSRGWKWRSEPSPRSTGSAPESDAAQDTYPPTTLFWKATSSRVTWHERTVFSPELQPSGQKICEYVSAGGDHASRDR